MSTPTTWTDERVKTLRELWEGGATAAQIADTLGGVSRDAVLGKVHRLGLSGRAPAKKAAPKPAAHARPVVNSTKRPAQPQAASEKPPKRARDDEGKLAPLPLPDDAPEDLKPLCVPYAQRRPNQCCEIIGDPAADDVRCCGLPVVDLQKQICAGHLVRNYKPNDPAKAERYVQKLTYFSKVA